MDVVRTGRRCRGVGMIAAVFAIAAAAGTVVMSPPAGASVWGPITLRSVLSGQCLDVLGFDASDGATIGQWGCNGAANQVWDVDNHTTPGDTWLIRSRWSGKCMDVAQADYSPGTRVMQFWCHGGPNQLFTIADGDGSWGSVTFHPVDAPGYCLDVLGYTYDQGATLGIWPCNGAANQKFVGTWTGGT